MKKILVILSLILFVGCGSKYPYPSKLSSMRSVVHLGGNNTLYFYAPYDAPGTVLDSTNAAKYNFLSSGLLRCQKNYGLVYSKIELFNEEYLLHKKFLENITEKQKRMNYTDLLKDNKDFRELVSYITHLAKTNQIACIRPMTKKEVHLYKENAKREAKLSSDPRVAAARAYQQAAMMNFMAATAPKIVNYNVNHSGFVNYSGSVYHYGY